MATCIEPARKEDLPQMATLLGHLFAQEADFQPNAEAQLAGLRRIFGSPTQGQLLVAREDDEILGMVSLLWSTSTALGGRVAWLDDLVVAPDLRGHGLGKALLSSAVAFCRERGLRRITLLTDGDNTKAQTLYESFGFELSAMVPMRLML
jgi:ribosomal protein S18 acetylase RimI-like enzyme